MWVLEVHYNEKEAIIIELGQGESYPEDAQRSKSLNIYKAGNRNHTAVATVNEGNCTTNRGELSKVPGARRSQQSGAD